MIVSIIGLGHIGLPTAAILSSRAFTVHGSSEPIVVVGIDVNQHTVDTINQGKIHFVEPDLDMLVKAAVQTGNLRATVQFEKADVFMVAVPTPFKENHEPDLSFIEYAAKSIAPVLEKDNLVVLESTSPVGTTEKVMEWMRAERPDLSFPEFGVDNTAIDVAVAHCPERVLQGNVVHELIENDRIIGGISTRCKEKARDFYKLFVKGDCLITDCRTAELCKLVENSFRDVNIAFANELSLICDKLDINVWELIKLANHHPRVNILQPGPGVGGHCIAVDPWFIVNSVPSESKLIQTARLVNDDMPQFVLNKINKAVVTMGKEKSELSVSCLGLTFKPDIDDSRESPAMEIARQVGLMGFQKQYLVEPNIQEIPNEFDQKNVELVELETALVVSDVVVLLVDHTPFKEMDLSLLSGKQVVDTRGIWSH